MERRFRVRLEELLEDAMVPPGLLRGVLPRLQTFLEPFVASLVSDEQRTNARHYVQGLQKFLGQAPWDHRPLLIQLARSVAAELGEPDGVLVFDPSSFPKKGKES